MMKRLVILLAFLTLAIPVQAQILNNADFEDGDTGQMSGTPIPDWNVWGWNGWHHDDAGAVIDTKAMKMWWDDSGMWQDFAATPGVTYDFSVQCLDFSGDTSPINWNGLIKAEFYDPCDVQLANVELERFDSTLEPDDVWTEIGDSIVAPAGTSYGRIVLMVVDWQDGIAGAINFDNASVTPEPTTIALLGLGGLLVRRRRRA